MALTDWMVQFDTATSEWLTRLEAEKDHDRYYALFNEQPSVSKYTQNTKYQSNLDILEKYLEDAIAKDAWYKEIRYYRDLLMITKHQIFTKRILEEVFGDKIKCTSISEYSDHSIELYKDDGTYIGRLEFNDGYCPHIVDFTTFNGQPFWLISEFVKDVNDCLGLVPDQ